MNPSDDALDGGAVAALAKLPEVGPVRLAAILRHHRPLDAFERIAAGRALDDRTGRTIPRDQLVRMRAAAASLDPIGEARTIASLGLDVTWLGCDDYPPVLAIDPSPPPALFLRGAADVLDARRVGIVGTRNPSTAGLATARELGTALAGHGVTVVSGLARGIDGAAHRGVRESGGTGRAIAVVGSGPDVVYPRQHADLWRWVGHDGLLVSEWPPGTPPDAWRFPARNRIIAALSEVVIVVESRERGGSLITARAALDRGIDVMAVPGSPRVRSALGANRLLRDGAAPVTGVEDVLDVLRLDHHRHGTTPVDRRPVPVGEQAEVLRACEAEPCTLDLIAERTGLPLTRAALAAARLEQAGWLAESSGWFEPTRSHFAADPQRWVPEQTA